MFRLLLLCVMLGAGCGIAVAWPRSSTVSTQVASVSLDDIRAIGQARLLIAEIDILQDIDPGDGRRLTAVIPIRLVLGSDLSRMQRSASGLRLAPVRVLTRSSDPARWTVWAASGPLVRSGEAYGLHQQAEILAGRQAEEEARRLGWFNQSEERLLRIFAPLGPVSISRDDE